MADTIIQLPYVGTTSGDILDASSLTVGAQTVKRERMIIGNDTSSHVAIVTTSGALTVVRTTAVSLSSAISLSSGTVTFSSNPTVVLTSGALLSSNNLTGIIGTSGGQAVVTTSGGMAVTVISGGGSTVVSLSSAPTVNISSGLITLSSAIGVSSGLITLTGVNVVTNASSGYVQALINTTSGGLGAPVSSSFGLLVGLSTGLNYMTLMASSGGAIPATSSGGLGITILGGAASGSTAINVVGSSNAIAPATSSGGLLVTFTNSVAGSTNTMISGSTGTIAVISSAGALIASIVSSGGIYAPVTSSAGLLVNATVTGGAGSTAVTIQGAAGVNAPVTSSGGLLVDIPGRFFIQVLCTVGAVISQNITTAPARIYSVSALTTQVTSQYFEIYNSTTTVVTGAPTNAETTLIRGLSQAVVNSNLQIVQSLGGIICTGGISVVGRLTLGSTASMTAQIRVQVEYAI